MSRGLSEATLVKWEPVPGFERYQISDTGSVYSSIRRGRMLRQRVGSHGYKMVSLRSGGKTYTFLTHRLVAQVFLGDCPEDMEVCHVDGDCLNNKADNLKYGTSSENKMDTVRHGTHNEARKTACPKNHPYTRVDSEGARRCGVC